MHGKVYDMERIEFKEVRKFVDFIKSHNERIWIKQDQPKKLLLGAIDEYLDYFIEISLVNVKEQMDSLTTQEKSIFKNNRNYCELTNKKITEYQKYFLSDEYWLSLSTYIQRKVRQKLNDGRSTLRKCKIDYLPEKMLSKYKIDEYEKVFYLDKSQNISEFIVKDEKEFVVPTIEICSHIENDIENIWDIDIDNVINNKSILEKENEIFKSFLERSPDSLLTLIIRTDLTTLPAVDLIHKKIGFMLFENIGFLAVT